MRVRFAAMRPREKRRCRRRLIATRRAVGSSCRTGASPSTEESFPQGDAENVSGPSEMDEGVRARRALLLQRVLDERERELLARVFDELSSNGDSFWELDADCVRLVLVFSNTNSGLFGLERPQTFHNDEEQVVLRALQRVFPHAAIVGAVARSDIVTLLPTRRYAHSSLLLVVFEVEAALRERAVASSIVVDECSPEDVRSRLAELHRNTPDRSRCRAQLAFLVSCIDRTISLGAECEARLFAAEFGDQVPVTCVFGYGEIGHNRLPVTGHSVPRTAAYELSEDETAPKLHYVTGVFSVLSILE